MKVTRAVLRCAEECADKVAMMAERFGITHIDVEMNFSALSSDEVMPSPQRFDQAVIPWFR